MKGCDMIVSLMHLPKYELAEGVQLKKAYPGDKEEILAFVGKHFNKGWVAAAETALVFRHCFLAVKDEEILGFACYDVSTKGFFGPIGVRENTRGTGVGKALLVRTLEAMRADNYGYAIIGWVSEAEAFYRKTVGAEFIAGGTPENSIYADMIHLHHA